MAAKGAAERTRMRRIRRIGPIYGATCHRSGFRRREISPAMVPRPMKSSGETERGRYIRRKIFWGKRSRKIDARIERGTD